MRWIIAPAALAALVLAGPVAAQEGSTGSGPAIPGGGAPPTQSTPSSGIDAEKTGSIASTGKTKPPGAPVGDDMGTRPDLERRSREIDHQIRTGICRGC